MRYSSFDAVVEEICFIRVLLQQPYFHVFIEISLQHYSECNDLESLL